MNATLSRRWLATLTVILAALYAAIGLAGQGLVRPAGLLGAAAILASLVLARRARPLAIALLLLGVTPLVALTWWSIATPVIAIACLTLGWPRRTRSTIAANGHALAEPLPAERPHPLTSSTPSSNALPPRPAVPRWIPHAKID